MKTIPNINRSIKCNIHYFKEISFILILCFFSSISFSQVFDDCNTIHAEVSNIQCYNQGTIDPSDDYWTFDITVTDVGGNGTYWWSSDPVDQGGSYGTKTIWMDNIDTSGDPLVFQVYDAINEDCKLTVVVDIPQNCSEPCEVVVEHSVGECNDNDTSDPSDDFYYIYVTVSGTNGNNWFAKLKNEITGAEIMYPTVTGDFVNYEIGPLLISDGDWTLWVMMEGYFDCNYDVYVPAPESCSKECECENELGEFFFDTNDACVTTLGALTSNGCPGAEYIFDFGDGSPLLTSDLVVVNHTYPGNGTYDVTITYIDPDGGADCAAVLTGQVIIEDCNACPCDHPEVLFYSDTDENCVTTLGLLSDVFCPNTTFVFDLGDGSLPVSSSTSIITHIFPGDGIYDVSVTMIDAIGGIDCAETVSGQVNIEGCNGCECDLQMSGFFYDINQNCETTIGALNSNYCSESVFTFDFGDGSPVLNSSSPVVNHTYTSNGTFEVTITLSDPNNEDDCDVVLVGEVNTEDCIIEECQCDLSLTGFFSNSNANCIATLGALESEYCDDSYFVFEFGDGSPALISDVPVVNHQYPGVGLFNVTITLIDPNDSPSCAQVLTGQVITDGCVEDKSFQGSNGKFDIYPNPSQGIINFDIDLGDEHIQSFVIYDSKGQVVKTIDLTRSSNKTGVISGREHLDLAPGIYNSVIMTDEKSVTKKILIK